MSSQRARLERFLKPGEYFVGDARFRVRTLLGSCVSVALWQPQARIGALTHFLLPGRTEGHEADGAIVLDGRYGNESLALILRTLKRRGVAPHDCIAKVCGGGNMFPGHHSGGAGDVGRRNGEAACALLAQHGIKVASRDLYGVGHRQVVFDIATGDVRTVQVAPGDAATTLRALAAL